MRSGGKAYTIKSWARDHDSRDSGAVLSVSDKVGDFVVIGHLSIPKDPELATYKRP